MTVKLIPELDVADLQKSLAFYVDVVGCNMLYERPEERFAFLDLEGAWLMPDIPHVRAIMDHFSAAW